MKKINIINIQNFLDFLTHFSIEMVSFQIEGDSQRLWVHQYVAEEDEIATFHLNSKDCSSPIYKKDCNSLIDLIKKNNLDNCLLVNFSVDQPTDQYSARETYYTIQNNEIIITIMKD